jgi:hypothetical protein
LTRIRPALCFFLLTQRVFSSDGRGGVRARAFRLSRNGAQRAIKAEDDTIYIWQRHGFDAVKGKALL